MQKPPSYSASTEQAIPARVVIGVTGHRKLENQPVLTDAVRIAIQQIRQMMSSLRSTPLALCVLSPLAEGADRLVAREVLKGPDSMLEVVLPLEKDDFMQDFQINESKEEFEKLLSQASSVRVLPPRSSRTEAYAQVGRYVVDKCDVLIALWDGKPAAGQGGTAEIVQHARETNCPLIWIHTEDPPRVTLELGRGLTPRPFRELDGYNSERVNRASFEKQFKKLCDFFYRQVDSAKLSAEKLHPILAYILRHYAKADLLALHYQHAYYRAESVVYALALLAVVIAAFQILFLPNLPVILVSEVVLMLAVLAIVGIGRRRRWHSKWIDYRFLAERFRSALFIAVADVDVAMLRRPRHLRLAYSPKDWMVVAFASVWSHRPRPPVSAPSIFRGLKEFLGEAWIQDQIHYHESTRKRHYKRHRRMTIAGYTMFGLTIFAVLLHVANVGPHFSETVFAFMAIVFPAIAANITAIRTHRDYLRNSMRSAEMVRHLEELKSEITEVQDYNSFIQLVKEIEEAMLHENEDWRVVVRFHTPEVPV